MTTHLVEFMLLFVAVLASLAACKTLDNNKADQLAREKIEKILRLPQKPSGSVQKSEDVHAFKIKIGGKLFAGEFSYDNCNKSAPLVLSSLSISPDPIHLDSEITVGFNGTVGVQIDSSLGLSAKLVLKKKIGIWIEIPCTDNVGSCTYGDVCSMIPPTKPADCPAPLPDYDLPCSCTPPVTKGTYSLPPTKFTIPPIPDIPSWLETGDYEIGVKAYDKAGTNLACYDFKLTLA